MSLNWREIDRILEELALPGCLVQEVHQPTHDTLVFEMRNRGGGFRLLVSLASGNARLHRLTVSPPNPEKPPRFASFLRAHVRGGRVVETGQVRGQRVVRLAIDRGEERCLLWIRLWPTAANVIATTADGRILETFYRRPKRGEIAGGRYDAEALLAAGEPARSFDLRELAGEGDFNARIERNYRLREAAAETERLRQALLAELHSRENGILVQKGRLEKQMEGLKNPERMRQIGDIIMANLHTLAPAADHLEAEDFAAGGGTVVIELDPRLTGPRNAQRYYERASAARRGAQRVADEIAALEQALAQVAARRASIDKETSLPALRAQRKAAPRHARELVRPGLAFGSHGHRIMVGRTAADNDALLRSHVAGNDYWFHARDWPGAYVFVKTPRGKSVPLEVMLDAANLAVFYSKGRTVGSGDVYYTQVKYLRRVQAGKPGLVIPTHEKNLFVRLDGDRVEQIKQSPVVE